MPEGMCHPEGQDSQLRSGGRPPKSEQSLRRRHMEAVLHAGFSVERLVQSGAALRTLAVRCAPTADGGAAGAMPRRSVGALSEGLFRCHSLRRWVSFAVQRLTFAR